MTIDKKRIYHFGRYSYVNFCMLNQEQLTEILKKRNHPDIRKCMNNTEPISLDDHLNFCSTLFNRDDKYYWLITKDENPVGVLNIIDVDHQKEIGEPGFYLFPEVMGRGESIFFLSNYKTFLLQVIGFKGLIGHNYYDNMPALVFTMFFGGVITDLEDHDGRLSIKTILTPETLQNGEGTKKMVLNYAKFARSWNADEAIKDFRNAK
ncbi:hypothetical protein [Bacteroides heparinolyticus]|uniref:Putative LPS biosynthesis Acetyltransferase n=1 Tax=Prevotella heparinolytica TaxID=28113 RepID=A0A449I7R3_9BACE|nr:hypothetical protein [Bacteroides heparinolyticus]MCI6213158.1 hypothetical protein [Bacteroides heparinolyticus]VFB15463.1 putative LPS biosynthesis Acetyltransferase [Bacteroides heparinolyticus]